MISVSNDQLPPVRSSSHRLRVFQRSQSRLFSLRDCALRARAVVWNRRLDCASCERCDSRASKPIFCHLWPMLTCRLPTCRVQEIMEDCTPAAAALLALLIVIRMPGETSISREPDHPSADDYGYWQQLRQRDGLPTLVAEAQQQQRKQQQQRHQKHLAYWCPTGSH